MAFAKDQAQRGQREVEEAPVLVEKTRTSALPDEARLFLALQALARRLGRAPAPHDYRELREAEPDLPSFTKLYRAYGRWSELLEEIELRCAPTTAHENIVASADDLQQGLLVLEENGVEAPLRAEWRPRDSDG